MNTDGSFLGGLASAINTLASVKGKAPKDQPPAGTSGDSAKAQPGNAGAPEGDSNTYAWPSDTPAVSTGD